MSSEYYSYPRDELHQFVPDRRRNVLEIGCGTAKFLSSLSGVDETWGIEPDETSANVAAERLTHVLHGTFESTKADLPKEHFDLVICNDVIEHMTDHDRFFEQIKSTLRPGGYLMGSIPNVRYYANLFRLLFEKDWRYQDAGILDRTHLRFFTEESLRRCLISHGFRIEVFRGINSFPWERSSLKRVIYQMAAYVAIAATVGYWSDIRFLQFGFRASLNS